MRILIAALLSLTIAGGAWAGSTVTFGSKVISTGDSVGRVYTVAGQPSRVVQLVNKYGAGTGERLDYFIGDKTVQITIQDSRVVRVDEIR